MSSLKKITFKGFLDTYYRSKDIDSREVLQLLRQAEIIPQKLMPFNGIIHVIDYTQRRHVGLSGPLKNMMGFDPREILESGLDFVIDVFHKDDFKIYNEVVFPQVADILQKTPLEDHNEIVFTYSYRMKRDDGRWVNLFQQGSYITDPKTNLPLYGIALVTDITPLKKDNSMIFAIDKKEFNNNTFSYRQNILTQYYFPDPDEAKLSRREREILSRLADGFSSKQIADKLFLSESTIVNHRKNMLKKTNAKNVAELIRYAINKGII